MDPVTSGGGDPEPIATPLPSVAPAAPDYRLLFESAPALLLLLGVDPAYTILDASDAYLRATRATREEIVGRGLFEVLSGGSGEQHERAAANLRASLDGVRAGGAVDTTTVEKYVVRRAGHEGGDVEERYWSFVNAPVRAPGGGIRWIMHRVEDVTEFVRATTTLHRAGEPMHLDVLLERLRQQGEERLAEANRELRRCELEQQTLLDVLPIGIGIATDPDCRRIVTNRAFAATLGLRRDANASKTAPDGQRPTTFRVLTPDGVEIPGPQLPMQRAAREGRTVIGIELDVVRDDGRVVRLLEYAAPLFDEQGAPRGAVGAFVDVTASHQARRTLTRSEERYRRIFDTAGVSIWEEDATAIRAAFDRLRASGVDDIEAYLASHPEFVRQCIGLLRVVDVNRATLRMFGAPDKASLMRSLEHVFEPTAVDVFAGALAAFARGDRRYEAEAAQRTLDGRSIHALLTMTFPGPGESDESILVSLADITDRKIAENALRRSETLFREMADTAPVMLWITHAGGQCTFLSRGWYEFTGQTPETGLGVGWIDAVHPDDRGQAAASFLAANERREPFRQEYRLRSHEGAYRWVIDAARPRVDENGLFAGYIGAVIDISERKAAETALREEVAVRTTLAQVGASLAGELKTDKLVEAVTDAATKLTEAEIGAFFYDAPDDTGDSYSLSSLAGAPRHALPGLSRARAAAIFGPTARRENSIRLDDITAHPDYERTSPFHDMGDGRPRVRSYLAVPVVGGGDSPVGGLFFGHSRPGVFTIQHELLASGVAAWAAIAVDNARLYRDVEEANRLKDEFLATLSHELRTPLNAVLGWARMLREGPMQPAMHERALESIERNARAQAQLVDDLLDVSRIVAGKLHIKADPVDLASVIVNAVETVRAGASAKRLDLRVHLPRDERPIVTGDADRLQQVVWNLVSNAIKFTSSGGRIDVELRSADAKAEILVRDTGQGIAPAFLRHLFQRFRQMDASTARRHGGLGLGLSIVRHLTEAHGGTVAAESAGEGQGATFRVRFPLRAAQHPDPRPPADPAEPGRDLAGARILVVDDEADARELLRYVLENRGADVETAVSAGEALHLLGEGTFHVLIADIGIPELDGYALIRLVRQLPAAHHRGIPAIAVTAYASARERDQALDAGYDWHLGKPVEPEHLVATVSAAKDRGPRAAADPSNA